MTKVTPCSNLETMAEIIKDYVDDNQYLIGGNLSISQGTGDDAGRLVISAECCSNSDTEPSTVVEPETMTRLDTIQALEDTRWLNTDTSENPLVPSEPWTPVEPGTPPDPSDPTDVGNLPLLLFATYIGEGKARLSWMPMSGAIGYHVYWLVGTTWFELGTTTGQYYNLSGLAAGGEYTFAVAVEFGESLSARVLVELSVPFNDEGVIGDPDGIEDLVEEEIPGMTVLVYPVGPQYSEQCCNDRVDTYLEIAVPLYGTDNMNLVTAMRVAPCIRVYKLVYGFQAGIGWDQTTQCSKCRDNDETELEMCHTSFTRWQEHSRLTPVRRTITIPSGGESWVNQYGVEWAVVGDGNFLAAALEREMGDYDQRYDFAEFRAGNDYFDQGAAAEQLQALACQDIYAGPRGVDKGDRYAALAIGTVITEPDSRGNPVSTRLLSPTRWQNSIPDLHVKSFLGLRVRCGSSNSVVTNCQRYYIDPSSGRRESETIEIANKSVETYLVVADINGIAVGRAIVNWSPAFCYPRGEGRESEQAKWLACFGVVPDDVDVPNPLPPDPDPPPPTMYNVSGTIYYGLYVAGTTVWTAVGSGSATVFSSMVGKSFTTTVSGSAPYAMYTSGEYAGTVSGSSPYAFGASLPSGVYNFTLGTQLLTITVGGQDRTVYSLFGSSPIGSENNLMIDASVANLTGGGG
jgi:hypothetical protein